MSKKAKINIADVPRLEAYVNLHNEIDKIITPSYKKKNLKSAPIFNNITEVKKYMQDTQLNDPSSLKINKINRDD